MSTAKLDKPAPALMPNNVVPFSGIEGAVTRENGLKSLPTTLDASSHAKILAIYQQAEQKADLITEKEIKATRALAMRLLSKRSTALKLVTRLKEQGVEPTPVLFALLNVAQSLVPRQVVTAETLSSLVGTKPEGITARWWRDELPLLLDFVGLTDKTSRTERVFNDYEELLKRCYVFHKVIYSIGHVGYSTVDSLAAKVITSNPYIEVKRDGEVITYQRPEQTSEGKDAKRKADYAEYLAKQKAREQHYSKADDEDEGHGQARTYKKPLIAAGIALAVFVIASMQPDKEFKPEPQAASINPAAIAAQVNN